MVLIHKQHQSKGLVMSGSGLTGSKPIHPENFRSVDNKAPDKTYVNISRKKNPYADLSHDDILVLRREREADRLKISIQRSARRMEKKWGKNWKNDV